MVLFLSKFVLFYLLFHIAENVFLLLIISKNIRSLLIRENAPDQIVPQPSSSTKIDDPEALTKEETEELNLLVNIYEAKKLRGKRSTTQRGGKDKTYFEQKDNDNVFLSKLEDVDERSPEELGRAFVLAKAGRSFFRFFVFSDPLNFGRRVQIFNR